MALTVWVSVVTLGGVHTVGAQLVPPAPYIQTELPQCALHLYRHLSKTGGACASSIPRRSSSKRRPRTSCAEKQTPPSPGARSL